MLEHGIEKAILRPVDCMRGWRLRRRIEGVEHFFNG